MRIIDKLKLTQLSKAELENRQMNILKGGVATDGCGCGCNYTSTSLQNRNANSKNGYEYSGGGEKECVTWTDSNNNGVYDTNEYSISNGW